MVEREKERAGGGRRAPQEMVEIARFLVFELDEGGTEECRGGMDVTV